MRINILTYLLLTAVFFLHNAEAQEKLNDKKQRITFFTASWEPMDDALYYLKGGTVKNPEFEKISLTEMSRSLPYDVKAKGSLSFYKKVGQDKYIKSVSVQLPLIEGSDRRYLLLFMPPKDNQYRIKVIRDSRKYSPFGAYVFYNYGTLPIKGMLANKRFDIAHGQHKLIQIQLKPGSPMPFATLTEIRGKNKWLQRNTFHFNPKKHSKFFLYRIPTANGKFKIQAKAIVEFEPSKKQASAFTFR